MLTYTAIGQNKRNSVFLIGIFLVIIIALGFVFSRAYNLPGLLPLAVIFSVTSALISYFFGGNIALAISGAKQISKQDHPELYNIVENLAITAGLPTPKIYIIEDTAINAFATGRDPKHSMVCVTTGCLQRLEKVELEGVLAHELSHVGNYDIRFMAIVVILVGTITLLADWMLRASFWGGKRSKDSENANGIFMLIGIVLALLSPIIAMLLQLAVSRQREYLADSTGALLTRYPEGLARALEKIAKDTEPLESANKATASLYISNPFKDGQSTRSWFAGLFNTHPPIADRIKRLREMNL